MTPTSRLPDNAAMHPAGIPADNDRAPGASPAAATAAPPMGAGALPPAGSGVVDTAGEFGTVMSHHALEGAGGLADMVVVRHREQQVLLPASLFEATSPTSFRIPLSFNALMHRGGMDGSVIIPVLQEEMTVGTRLVDSGRGVRVHKTVVETPQAIERDLLQDRLQVETVTVGRLLEDDELPQARQEGELLIVPVVEEVLVVQVRRRLKEEIHLRRTSELVRRQQTVMLRTEQVRIERFDESGPPGPPGPSNASDASDPSSRSSPSNPANPTNAVPHPAGATGLAAGGVGTASPAPAPFGAAEHINSPGATQREVSAGTRLSS